VFENRELRRIVGHKREEVTGCCRKLLNEKLCNMYSSPDNIRMFKSWRMRWVMYVVRIREIRNA
jgi:hypothetical protein